METDRRTRLVEQMHGRTRTKVRNSEANSVVNCSFSPCVEFFANGLRVLSVSSALRCAK